MSPPEPLCSTTFFHLSIQHSPLIQSWLFQRGRRYPEPLEKVRMHGTPYHSLSLDQISSLNTQRSSILLLVGQKDGFPPSQNCCGEFLPSQIDFGHKILYFEKCHGGLGELRQKWTPEPHFTNMEKNTEGVQNIH